MAAEPKKEETVRLGVVLGDELRSLSFSITRREEEVYLASRDFPQLDKLSLHSSRKHRLAEQTTAKRPATISSQLLRFNEGQFWTIARILLTTRDGWNAGPALGKAKKGTIALPVCDRRQFVSVAIGMTEHHPDDHKNTSRVEHAAVIKVSDGKFLTVTVQVFEQRDMTRWAYDVLALKADAGVQFTSLSRTGSVVHDQLVTSFTNLHTYLFWGHHGLDADGNGWFAHHPLSREMLRGQADIRAGKFTGLDKTAILRRLAPDYRWQLDMIRAGKGRDLNSADR